MKMKMRTVLLTLVVISAFSMPVIAAESSSEVETDLKTVLSNQDKILNNQKVILGDQDKILNNQKVILGNQDKILDNQKKLDQILQNQKTIIEKIESKCTGR